MGLPSGLTRGGRERPLRWSVVVSSPKGEAGDQWGDTWFARDLVDALQRQGQEASVVFRGGATSAKRSEDDVVLVLRGLRRVDPRDVPKTPKSAGPVWMQWVISHPELVEADEPAAFDATFAASNSWARAARGEFGVPITPLLQATNPRRFNPEAAAPDSGWDVLFVGSTRGEFRPVVRDSLAAGVNLSVFGVGWSGLIPEEVICGEFLPNPELPAAYASAGVVLNDHWSDMAAEGFLSNRLFDAVASGARVLSDEATGLSEVFGDAVVTFANADELAGILHSDRDQAFPDRAQRIFAAKRVARDHSFDARAEVLVKRARELRNSR